MAVRVVPSPGEPLPHDYRIDVARRLVRTRLVGDCDVDELIRLWAEVARDPSFEPAMSEFLDLRAGSMPTTFRDALRLSMSDPFAACSRRASLVPDTLHYAFGRMYESVQDAGAFGLHPCHTLDEAAAWLHLGAEVLDAPTDPYEPPDGDSSSGSRPWL